MITVLLIACFSSLLNSCNAFIGVCILVLFRIYRFPVSYIESRWRYSWADVHASTTRCFYHIFHFLFKNHSCYIVGNNTSMEGLINLVSLLRWNLKPSCVGSHNIIVLRILWEYCTNIFLNSLGIDCQSLMKISKMWYQLICSGTGRALTLPNVEEDR